MSVVRAVVAGEAGGRALVPAILPVQPVELLALVLQRVDAALVVDVEFAPVEDLNVGIERNVGATRQPGLLVWKVELVPGPLSLEVGGVTSYRFV